jgi:Fasciclin domain
MNFNRKMLAATVFLAGACISGVASAEMTKMVGGAAMYPSKNIIQNAVNSKANTTLVAAVKAAGLVDTLQGPGPFTVFAPTSCRVFAEAREQGSGYDGPDLSRCAGASDHGRPEERREGGWRTGDLHDGARRADDDHGKGKGFRHHRFERPHSAHHDRRCSSIERRHSCHQQGSDALNGLMQG